jgi:hypothetical protein
VCSSLARKVPPLVRYLRAMKPDSAAIVIATAALVVILAVQGFGSSEGRGYSGPEITSFSTPLGMLGHPFQIVVAVLHACAAVVLSKPHLTRTATSVPRAASPKSSRREGEERSAVPNGKSAGSAVLQYLVLVLSSLD